MLEIRLIALFAISVAVILINGVIIIKSCHTYKSSCKLLVPVTNETEDIELIVRTLVYKLADEYPEATVLLINFNADSEKIRIFEKLMEHSCNYTIINCEKSSENVCNIAESVLY
ncbi:MAG: hypothetical protein J6K17_09965 [Oscillospiraceae bacterium]|nr:hypothetical protein [Oscillospiraceae bacterium]